jgi:SAM-dependent methyltransferase
MGRMRELTPIKLKTLANCPICGSENLSCCSQKESIKNNITYMRCQGCTFVFMNPQITMDSLKAVFSSSSYWKGTTNYADYSLLRRMNLMTARKRAQYLSGFLPDRAHILEVGCATGQFLQVCQQLDFKITGIDISSYQSRIHQLPTANSPKIRNISLDDFASEYRDDPFDAVCLWGIEGNLPDLVGAFEKIHKLLKTRGILAFNWMNFDHWLRPMLFGSFRQGVTSLSNLTPQSYTILLQRTHFRQRASSADLQYVNMEKYCSLSGHKRMLKLVRFLRISRFIFPLPTLLGKLAILQKCDEVPSP